MILDEQKVNFRFESLELNQLEPEEGQKLFDETAAITKQRTVSVLADA